MRKHFEIITTEEEVWEKLRSQLERIENYRQRHRFHKLAILTLAIRNKSIRLLQKYLKANKYHQAKHGTSLPYLEMVREKLEIIRDIRNEIRKRF